MTHEFDEEHSAALSSEVAEFCSLPGKSGKRPKMRSYNDGNLLMNSGYRCCCKNCDVLIGTKIVASIMLVIYVLVIAANVMSLMEEPIKADHIIELSSSIVGILILGLLFYGLHKERAILLIPYLVYQVIFILVTLFVLVLGIIELLQRRDELIDEVMLEEGLDTSDKGNRKAVETGYTIGIVMGVGVVLLVCALFCWFFSIVWSCYRYFKEKALSVELSPRIEFHTRPPPFYHQGSTNLAFSAPHATMEK